MVNNSKNLTPKLITVAKAPNTKYLIPSKCASYISANFPNFIFLANPKKNFSTTYAKIAKLSLRFLVKVTILTKYLKS